MHTFHFPKSDTFRNVGELLDDSVVHSGLWVLALKHYRSAAQRKLKVQIRARGTIKK